MTEKRIILAGSAIAILSAIAMPPVTAAELPNIVDRAFRNMPPVSEDWAYTRSRENRQGTRVERYDPATEPSWRLVSVDGRDPTAEEQEDYTREIEERARKDWDRPGDNDFEGLAQKQGWEKLEETDQRVTYRFLPKPEALDDRAPADRLEGVLTIAKAVPYVESFRLYNTEPFRAKLVAKIEHVSTEVQMTRVDERTYLPSAVFTTIRGSALGLKDIDRQVVLRYSDFRRAGAPSGTR